MSNALLANCNLLKVATSRLDYLKLNRELNTPPEQLRELEAKGVVAIAKCISACSSANFSLESAHALGVLFKESPDLSADS